MTRADVLNYVKTKYGTEPDYPFQRDTTSSVLRHKKSQKWYGLLMKIERNKLLLSGDYQEDVLTLKCEPSLSSVLRNGKNIFPAYHMNKEHWITLLLDDSLTCKEIYHLIDLSYTLTK